MDKDPFISLHMYQYFILISILKKHKHTAFTKIALQDSKRKMNSADVELRFHIYFIYHFLTLVFSQSNGSFLSED